MLWFAAAYVCKTGQMNSIGCKDQAPDTNSSNGITLRLSSNPQIIQFRPHIDSPLSLQCFDEIISGLIEHAVCFEAHQ